MLTLPGWRAGAMRHQAGTSARRKGVSGCEIGCFRELRKIADAHYQSPANSFAANYLRSYLEKACPPHSAVTVAPSKEEGIDHLGCANRRNIMAVAPGLGSHSVADPAQWSPLKNVDAGQQLDRQPAQALQKVTRPIPCDGGKLAVRRPSDFDRIGDTKSTCDRFYVVFLSRPGVPRLRASFGSICAALRFSR